MGVEISIQNMVHQWANAVHKFHLNAWNFEVEAGRKAQEGFKKSFELKKFNSRTKGNTTGWKSSNNSTRYGHPLMIETGTLRRSIKWKHLDGFGSEKIGATVYVDPSAFGTAKRHKGYCYANVHNDPNDRVRRKHMQGMPQRQFMGNSDIIDAEIGKLVPRILKGFPI